MNQRIADRINILGSFCGKRDIPCLTQAKLKKKYGFPQADVMVLFGGSVLCGGDVLAHGMKNNIAKKYVIVGGAGHTTQTLREQVHKEIPEIVTEGLPEAEVFAQYIKYKYDLKPDLLECQSTNCGNNITNLLELLLDNGISFNSIILTQDATMQYRMEAGMRKYVSDKITIINYAAYQAEVIVRNSQLVFKDSIKGIWEMERYISLLMGEIPRLSDDPEGYGPKGRAYIAHVTIPDTVQSAFSDLKNEYGNLIRKANPAYAT